MLKSELLNDPAFEFSHDSRQWVERVIFQFSLCFSLSLSHTHTYACVCAIFVYMYVCINGYFVICDWEFGLRLIGFQTIWCILFGLFVSLSFWVLRKKLHFFHLQEKKLDFCYFFSLSPCWTMDHSCRTMDHHLFFLWWNKNPYVLHQKPRRKPLFHIWKKTDFPWSPCEGEGLDCEEGCGLGGLWFRGGKDVWVGVWWGMYWPNWLGQ